MNQRIQQLGIAAGLIVEKWDGFNRRQLDPAEQKFAELIVRECVAVCWAEDGPESGTDTGWYLKEHFGVEE
jgi:hypothetical protein